MSVRVCTYVFNKCVCVYGRVSIQYVGICKSRLYKYPHEHNAITLLLGFEPVTFCWCGQYLNYYGDQYILLCLIPLDHILAAVRVSVYVLLFHFLLNCCIHCVFLCHSLFLSVLSVWCLSVTDCVWCCAVIHCFCLLVVIYCICPCAVSGCVSLCYY